MKSKLDGYRCVAVKRGSKVTLFSRNEKELNKRFPKIVDAVALLEGEFVLDGELVAFDTQGRPSFQVLQSTPSHELPPFFYAFDLLNQDGELLLSSPLVRRRKLLAELLSDSDDPLRLSPQLQASSGHVLEAVRKLNLEGVVGKRIVLPTNLVNVREHGSSTVQTVSRSSSLVVTFLERWGLMHCSLASTRVNSSTL